MLSTTAHYLKPSPGVDEIRDQVVDYLNITYRI